jgi:Lipocalin-like domain
MPRRSLIVVAVALVWLPPIASGQRGGSPAARDLIGTWILLGVDRPDATPSAVPNPRGLLVFDGAGYTLEITTRAGRTPYAGGQPTAAEALTTFTSYGGFWGRYRIDPQQRRISFRNEGALHPNRMGPDQPEEVRTYELQGNRLVVTSTQAQPAAPSGTRWTWERVPVLEGLSAAHRRLVGFWQHVMEQRVTLSDKVLSENRRAPSVIVYTPSGYVGVHFPPLNRARFTADQPTPQEALTAIRGYVTYFGSYTLYPGAVFHHQLAVLGPGQGNTLRRYFEMTGDQILLRFPPAQAQGQGEEARTVVTLKRLSGEGDMMP